MTKFLITTTAALALFAAPAVAFAKDADKAADKAAEKSEKSAEKAADKAEKAMDKAEKSADKAMDKSEKAAEKAMDKSEKAMDKAGMSGTAGAAATGAMRQDVTGSVGRQDTRQANFGNLISALNNISVEVGQLQALNNINVEDVRVVSADNLLRGANINALNNSLNRNNVEILNLQNVLNDNEVLKEFLNNNNIAVNDVVAVNVLSGGDIVIFTQGQ